MSQLQFRDVRGAELADGCALLARSLAFADRDALPPWLVQTSAAHGGLALGAFAGDELVGFSFALPGEPGTLFSCGLAVAPELRGRGVGRRLKLLQRERARAAGVRLIRWTADPLSVPALALYLGRLGARLVGYAPALYGAVRAGAGDDVVIEWRVADGPAPAAGAPTARVEVPLDRDARRLTTVRRAMTAALDAGGVGTDVAVDQTSRRAWVLFREEA